MPLKLVVGVNVTTDPLTVVVPLVTPVVAMLVNVPVIRLTRSMLIGVLKGVENGPGAAVTVGGAGRTVIFTGPEVADDPPGPLARYVKEPVPVKPAVGVKVTEFPLTVVVPLVAPITVMLVETPLMLAVRLIGAVGVLNAV